MNVEVINQVSNFVILIGIPIDKVALLNQDTRNYVGTKLLEITLMELFVFRFMQVSFFYSWILYLNS